MSFDDLFGLLLFVLFIALPALSRMTRSKKPSGGTPTRPGAPATGRGATASTARPGAPAPAGGTTSAGGGDELERRLAEARERVQRALGGPSGSSSGPASGGSRAPAGPTAVAPAPARPTPVRRTAFVSTDRDDGLLSTPLDPRAVGGLGPERTTPRRRPAPFAEAPALQVERRGGRSRSEPRDDRRAATFATDPETVRSAIIWHQVLGEPRARRPLGGRPSTLRSR